MDKERNKELPFCSLEESLEYLKIPLEFSPPKYIQLAEEPNVGFLKKLLLFNHEVVLFKWQGSWLGFAATENFFYLHWIPKNSKIDIHSHPGESLGLPSPEDLHAFSEKKLNFIVSKRGITSFTPAKRRPLEDIPGKPKLEELKVASRKAQNVKEYEKFLKASGVKWKLVEWPNNLNLKPFCGIK